MERDHFASGLTNEQLNFNSHAHVERDTDNLTALYIKIISTHTLTWSVTITTPRLHLILKHFNSHAHVERDETSSFYEGENKNFNSHAHVERDFVSLIKLSDLSNFNSHAHVERDAIEMFLYT